MFYSAKLDVAVVQALPTKKYAASLLTRDE